MRKAPIPSNEAARLESLCALGILDTASEERFDRVTRLARRLFGVPIALVSLVDAQRQWFKSRHGLEASETPRDISFCGHAILRDEVFVVPDASRDERFWDNPLVQGDPQVRFYAGCPLSGADGHTLGTLCVIDHKPREFDDDDLHVLCDLAAMVERELAALALATIDPLTKISNRLGLEALGQQTLALAQRTDKPVTAVFIDLDRFKEINDVLGHAAGDRAIVEMAELLLESFRDSDVIARLGGDEFCVLMSGARETGVGRPLARLDENLRQRNGSRDPRFPLAYSAGVVLYDPARHVSLADLLGDADRQMYEHKRERRSAVDVNPAA
jgi:diguanylate cyclase (GGDEF)-like protein